MNCVAENYIMAEDLESKTFQETVDKEVKNQPKLSRAYIENALAVFYSHGDKPHRDYILANKDKPIKELKEWKAQEEEEEPEPQPKPANGKRAQPEPNGHIDETADERRKRLQRERKKKSRLKMKAEAKQKVFAKAAKIVDQALEQAGQQMEADLKALEEFKDLKLDDEEKTELAKAKDFLRGKRPRWIVFTWWKHCCPLTPAQLKARLDLMFAERKLGYAGWCLEEGEKNKKHHFQGFAAVHPLKDGGMSGVGWQAIFHDDPNIAKTIHIDVMRANKLANQMYCIERRNFKTNEPKEGALIEGPWTAGDETIVGQGAQSMGAVATMIKAGKTKHDIIEEEPAIYLQRRTNILGMIEDVKEKNFKPRDYGDINFIIIWGPPGTGKSTAAKKLLGGQYNADNTELISKPDWFQFTSSMRGKWNEMPDGCTKLLIPDFDGTVEYMTPATLKGITEPGPFRLDCWANSGAAYTKECNFKEIVLVTNVWPEDWWPDVRNRKVHIEAVQDRMSQDLIKMTQKINTNRRGKGKFGPRP